MHKFKSIVSSLGLAAGLVAASGSAMAARAVLTENFDGPGIPATFMIVNNSTGAGSVGTSPGWFQGVPAADGFSAQAGAANSYIAANFATATFGGNIRDWLLLPTQTYYAGDILTFFTRTEPGGAPFNDRLQVRYSTNGASTTISDFSNTLLDINGALNASYPTAWTQFLATLPAFTGRLAFLYIVNDTSANGDIVGIDTLRITSSIPEPATPLTMALGFSALALVLRRRSKQD